MDMDKKKKELVVVVMCTTLKNRGFRVFKYIYYIYYEIRTKVI